MAGTDTSRGIAYQNAQAVLIALDVLADSVLTSLRVEGAEDIVDIEVHDKSGAIVRGYQIKTRVSHRPWSRAPILRVLERWTALDEDASFEFVTDGELGETAVALRDALDSAALGDLGPLADFLGRSVDDESLARLARTRVRKDVTGAEAVLAVAEQQVRSLLPGSRTPQDLHAAATAAVNALLRELAWRAGSAYEHERLLTKDEIAQVLGGIRDVPVADRWSTGVKAEYLKAARATTPNLIELDLEQETREQHETRVELADLVDGPGVGILSGQTGSGKSSTAKIAVHEGSLTGRPVVLVHAEAYVAGRLADLVTEGLSAIVDRPLPSTTGQQALSDPDVVLVIDGVSEVPVEMQQAIRLDLQPVVTSGSGARVVLVGRDLASLSSVVPTSVPQRQLAVSPLSWEKKVALIRRQHADLFEGRSEEDVAQVANRLNGAVGRGLGDASGNPMIFSMALRFAVEGQEFDSDASLYAATIVRIAERSGATRIDLASAALGLIFARLLDVGRRFVYPHEYRRLLREAVHQLSSDYFGADDEAVAETVSRTGLLVPLGADQVLVPVHDSYADYLAGVAHARGLIELPDVLSSGDERRLEFAVQLAGVDDATAVQVARDLPFTTIRLAAFDRRSLADEGAAGSIAAVLTHLLPPGDLRGPVMWQAAESTVVALEDDAGRDGRDDLRVIDLRRQATKVVLASASSPLAAAVALWRVVLKARLRTHAGLPARNASGVEDAADLVLAHLHARRIHLLQLMEALFQPAARSRIESRMGPVGVSAVISQEPTDFSEFSMHYRASQEIAVEVREGPLHRDEGSAPIYASSTRVEYFLSKSPEADAADAIRKAIEDLTKNAWLQ
jgi:hypothetical protein